MKKFECVCQSFPKVKLIYDMQRVKYLKHWVLSNLQSTQGILENFMLLCADKI